MRWSRSCWSFWGTTCPDSLWTDRAPLLQAGVRLLPQHRGLGHPGALPDAPDLLCGVEQLRRRAGGPRPVSVWAWGNEILDWAGLWEPLWFTWVDQAGEDMLLYRSGSSWTARGRPTPPRPRRARRPSPSTAPWLRHPTGKHYIAEELTRRYPRGAVIPMSGACQSGSGPR